MIILRRLFPQPSTAVFACFCAASAVAGYSWLLASPATVPQGHNTLLLCPLLVVATAACFLFPIHVRHNVKLYMATVPLFVMAACLAPIPAAISAAVAWFAGEILARKQTGAYISDMFSGSARYAVIVLAASAVMHSTELSSVPVRLFTGAAVYCLTEALTLPVVISPISGEPPLQVIKAFFAEAGTAETSQYAIGILGALVGNRYPWALALLCVPAGLTYGAFRDAKEIRETTVQMLESMADAVDLRDPTTGGHSRRVAEYTRGILRQMGKTGEEMNLVVSAARVHDIGKIGLPDSVLLKEGRLSDEETELMQSHPEAGAQLLRRYPEFSRGIDVVRHHHERWDGKGYPTGLKSTAVPFGARIVAVADSFDAMTSDRPYRKGMSRDVAKRIMTEGSGTQWDPEAVDHLLAYLDGEQPAPEVEAVELKSKATPSTPAVA